MKILYILLCLNITSITFADSPSFVRGKNNQVIGRVYSYNNTYRYYGQYNQPIGSSRNGSFYNSNNRYSGKIK